MIVEGEADVAALVIVGVEKWRKMEEKSVKWLIVSSDGECGVLCECDSEGGGGRGRTCSWREVVAPSPSPSQPPFFPTPTPEQRDRFGGKVIFAFTLIVHAVLSSAI